MAAEMGERGRPPLCIELAEALKAHHENMPI